MKILRLKDKKYITREELALELYKQGQKIMYCDIDCIAKDAENKLEQSYYLLDECGNYAIINSKDYKITE